MNLILYFVVLGIVLIACFVGFFIMKQKGKVISNKKAILYYLIFSIVITLTGMVGFIRTSTLSMFYFFILQLFFLGLGFVALYLVRKKIIGENEENKGTSALFIAINTFLGMIGFAIIFYQCSLQPILAPYYAMSVFTFTLPAFFYISLSYYRNISQEIYKVWYYPIGADEIDFDVIDTSVIYMLELEYTKRLNESGISNTKLRAPVSMKFGDWFRSFLDNYNDKYDSDPIQYLSSEGTPHGWIFYIKSSLIGNPRYIDPDLTITDNKLSENDTIIARRVKKEESVS